MRPALICAHGQGGKDVQQDTGVSSIESKVNSNGSSFVKNFCPVLSASEIPSSESHICHEYTISIHTAHHPTHLGPSRSRSHQVFVPAPPCPSPAKRRWRPSACRAWHIPRITWPWAFTSAMNDRRKAKNCCVRFTQGMGCWMDVGLGVAGMTINIINS